MAAHGGEESIVQAVEWHRRGFCNEGFEAIKTELFILPVEDFRESIGQNDEEVTWRERDPRITELASLKHRQRRLRSRQFIER